MKIYLILFLLSAPFPASAQVADTFYTDFKQFFKVGADLAAAPLGFDKKDWILLSAALAATAAAYSLDDQVHRLADRNINNFNNSLFEIDRYYYLEFAAVSMSAIYGYGLFTGDSEIRKLGYQLALATFYSGIFNVTMKMITGRTRTEANRGHDNFRPLRVDLNNSSFPSAHTTLAFSFSTVMASYSDNLFWKAGWFSAAGLVGAARIYHDKHWLSDVIFGAALGYFVADFVINNDEKDSEMVGIFITPYSIGFKYNF
jgi:membrane-associated phospholipid phosphatase